MGREFLEYTAKCVSSKIYVSSYQEIDSIYKQTEAYINTDGFLDVYKIVARKPTVDNSSYRVRYVELISN